MTSPPGSSTVLPVASSVNATAASVPGCVVEDDTGRVVGSCADVPTSAARVELITRFLAAFNAGNIDVAMEAFATDSGVSDCDYDHVRAYEARGRAKVASWLEERARDHDVLLPATYEVADFDPLVAGVGFARRTNDTLRRLGFPNGIVPNLAAKVRFSLSDGRLLIETFANGPIGGLSTLCQPR